MVHIVFPLLSVLPEHFSLRWENSFCEGRESNQDPPLLPTGLEPSINVRLAIITNNSNLGQRLVGGHQLERVRFI